ncbi:MAG: phosphoribosylanthranilate isomerase [Candidatus Omnitrophota bacterium]
MVKVKICGITNKEDALKAVELGADFLGFVFVRDTPRYIEKNTVKDIIDELAKDKKDATAKVGLFKDADKEEVIAAVKECGFDYVQLHGDETPAYCEALKTDLEQKYKISIKILKTFKVSKEILECKGYKPGDYSFVDYFLFDTFHPDVPGGTGERFDAKILAGEKENIEKAFFVAGGLRSENVSNIIRAVCPYGVDVSSGVESSPGTKDHNLLKEFITNAKNA